MSSSSTERPRRRPVPFLAADRGSVVRLVVVLAIGAAALVGPLVGVDVRAVHRRDAGRCDVLRARHTDPDARPPDGPAYDRTPRAASSTPSGS